MSAMEDLRDAYPMWSDDELKKCKELYEDLLKKEGGGVPFDEFARDQRRHRQWLRDQGLSIDDPPHPESQVVCEYDPLFPRCPKCSCESYVYMDAPCGDKAAFRDWIRNQGGKLQCPQCLEVFDLKPRLVDRIRTSIRLETIDEVLARKAKEDLRES